MDENIEWDSAADVLEAAGVTIDGVEGRGVKLKDGRVILGEGKTLDRAIAAVLAARDGLAPEKRLALFLAGACSIDLDNVVDIADALAENYLDDEEGEEEETTDEPSASSVRVRRT